MCSTCTVGSGKDAVKPYQQMILATAFFWRKLYIEGISSDLQIVSGSSSLATTSALTTSGTAEGSSSSETVFSLL
jgi:hypothetical protein